MNIKNERGLGIITVMAAYVLIKAIVNMVIGVFSISSILIALGMACMFFVLINKFNYVLAGILLLTVLIHLPDNLRNIGSNWIYLAEAAIDVVCAVTLIKNDDVKENYSGTINFN